MRQRRIPYYEGQSGDKKNWYIDIRTALLWVGLTAQKGTVRIYIAVEA